MTSDFDLTSLNLPHHSLVRQFFSDIRFSSSHSYHLPHNHTISHTSIAKMVSHISNHKAKKPAKLRSGAKWNGVRSSPPPSSPSGYKKPRLNGDNPFCRLPAEMHHKFLELLPQRDISSSRRTCQSLCERIRGRELSLAGPQIEGSIAALRAQLEEIKSRALPPSDADSFLESLDFWVSRRGYYASWHESSRSLQNWFGLVFGWEESATRRWARLAVEVMRLYQHLWTKAGNIPTTEKQRFLYEAGLSAPDISISMLNEIYLRLEAGGTGTFRAHFYDVDCLEYHAYPNEKKQQWKLTELEDESRMDSHWEDKMKKPRGDSKDLIRPLGLPELPSTAFCYYVQGKWAWRLINKYRAGTGLEMDPLMKVAVMKQIGLF